jgi:hypothetical protein
MKRISGELTLSGYLKWGHIVAYIEDDEVSDFESLSEDEQKEWLMDRGNVMVDDYEIEDFGEIDDITVEDD